MNGNLRPWHENLIVYMLLLMAGNPTVMLYKSLVFTVYKMFFLAGIVLLFLIFKDPKLKVKTNKIKMCFFFYCLIILSTIMNMDKNGITTLFSYFVFIMIGMLVSELIQPDKFGIVYINVMLFICEISLILFAVQICFPNELSKILWTNYYPNENIIYRSNIFFNVLVSVKASSEGNIWILNRNSGLFWEPGVFAMFLIPAIVCLIEFKERIHKYQIKLLILLITLISTISTMGIITLALIIIWYTIKNVKIFGVYITLASVFLFTIGISFLDSILKRMRYYMEDSAFISRTGISTLTMDNIKRSLLWGQGFNGTLSYNGYINLYFMFGILFFLVWIAYFYRGCCKVAGVVLFFSIVMGLTSEPVAFTAIFWVYIFYGMEEAKKEEMVSLKEPF